MSTARTQPGSRSIARRRGLLADLETPGDVVRHLGPNWFASVMGTGIVANAAALLPRQIPGLHAMAAVMWVLAVVLLAALTAGTAALWVRYPANARGHVAEPSMAPFYGAPRWR